MSFTVSGTLPKIIRNDAQVYEGNLRYYFKVVFNHAQNLQKGYHNFRHMFHVLWLCYQACSFYRAQLSPRQMRNLLIAAMWHDFDHPGMMGHDDLNIERAIRGLEKHLLEEDRSSLPLIVALIRSTEYPYKTATETLPLCAQIMRDSDMGQSFAMAWVQQIIFGLAEEWGKKPLEILQTQPAFLKGVKFYTEWGQCMFPQSEVDAKILETEELVELLA